MNTPEDEKNAYQKLLGISVAIGCDPQTVGLRTSEFIETHGHARDYILNLVPPSSISVQGHRILCAAHIEEALSDWEYSREFRDLGYFPIAECDNDKVWCLDCVYYGFVLFQLGMGTIQPIRKYLRIRITSLADLMKLLST